MHAASLFRCAFRQDVDIKSLREFTPMIEGFIAATDDAPLVADDLVRFFDNLV